MKARAKVIQSIHFPVSAKSFVAPIVSALNGVGISAELWFEPNRELSEKMNEMGLPARHVVLDFTANPLKFLQRLKHLRKELRAAEPSVLHAHQMRASLLPLIAARLEGLPVRIYHNHGLPYLGYSGLLRFLLRFLEKVNVSLATHVIFVSHSNLEAAIADGLLPRSKARVFANGSAVGIDFTKYSAESFSEEAQIRGKQKFGIGRAEFVLGYVGRPVARKGFHRLLNAWKKSDLSSKGGVLLIAGCTAEECKAVLGESVTGVVAIGYSPDLRPFYAACDALVLPSDHEGFPYALLEGAAAGKALIGTDIPGIRCAIEPDVTGLLVKRGDETGLQSAILKIFNDRNLRLKFGGNARARAIACFERDLVMADLLRFYQRDLGLGPRCETT